jgi:hypothetical protein
MIGVKPVCGFLGMLAGLLYGLAWGMHRGWPDLAAGLAIGGLVGFISGFIVCSVVEAIGSACYRISEDATQLSPSFGSFVRYLLLVIMIGAITLGGYWLLRVALRSLAQMSRSSAK